MYLPNSIFAGNVIVNSANLPSQYMFIPTRNYLSENLNSVGFIDIQQEDFRLANNSKFKGKGTNGKDPGVDFSLIQKLSNGNSLN